MKRIALAIALTTLAFAGSVFADPAPANQLTVTLNDKAPSFANVTGRSCNLQEHPATPAAPDDLKAAVMTIGGLTFMWTGPNPLSIQSVQVIITGNGVNKGAPQIVSTTGQDLAYLLDGSSGVLVDVQPNVSTTTSSECNWQVGSLSLDDSTKAVTGQGVIFVEGMTTDANGNPMAVNSQVPFTFSYTPAGS